MQFDPEELDRIADRLAERVREDIAEAVVPDDGTIKGLDPHRLYTAGQVAERWSVSKDTVYRNLERADWNGQGARFRGIDILRYEGVDVKESSSSGCTSSGTPSESPPEPTSEDVEDTPYNGTLPEI
jgi:hypothetical protein